jgi:hypothetical protein
VGEKKAPKPMQQQAWFHWFKASESKGWVSRSMQYLLMQLAEYLN